MKPVITKLTVVLGLTVALATPAYATVELGQSVTFSVGAIVVDVCQVANAYKTYINSASPRRNPSCTVSRPASDAVSEAVTTVTRAENGVITALAIEF